MTFVDFMAAISDDQKTLVLRFENPNPNPIDLRLNVTRERPWARSVNKDTLAGSSLSAVNDFDDEQIVPVHGAVNISRGGLIDTRLDPFSFTVFTLKILI